MTLWKLELLRLIRTHRWMIVVGVYLFFGATGPLTARFMNEILQRFGGEITVVLPDPRPVDGVVQFVANASQLGVLAVVVVAAGSLALDARPEIAAFLRTRVERAGRLLAPRYVAAAGAAVAALVAGTATAWALTAILLGPLPSAPMLVGTLLGALYLLFAVALVAAVAGFTRSSVVAVFGGLALLIMLPVIGLIPPVRPWLPSELLAAVAVLIEGAPARHFARSVAVAVVATAGLLAIATSRLGRREL